MTIFNQHIPSNSKVSTDDYLIHPSQFTYEENRETIKLKKESMEFIEISDEQIAKVRGEFDEDRGKGYNSLTIGDAMSILLAKEFKEYEGLQDPNEIEIMEENNLTASTEETIMNPKKRKKMIEDSYRDFDACSTVYFLKTI